MATEKKLTKKDMFAKLSTIVENSNVVDKTELLGFIDHEVELLERKSSKTTMTATQKANVPIMEDIKAILADSDKPMTVSELLATDQLNGYTNQKISALLTKLGEKGTNEVKKTIVKKVAYFSLNRD